MSDELVRLIVTAYQDGRTVDDLLVEADTRHLNTTGEETHVLVERLAADLGLEVRR